MCVASAVADQAEACMLPKHNAMKLHAFGVILSIAMSSVNCPVHTGCFFWIFYFISNKGDISCNNLQMVSANSCMPGKQQINATACKSKLKITTLCKRMSLAQMWYLIP